MSDTPTPTAADLREMADLENRGGHYHQRLASALRAGADAMDERDRLAAELDTERSASFALFVKLSYALGIKPDKQSWPVLCASYGPGEPAAEAADRVIAELARLRAENAELAEVLRPFAIGEYPNRVMPDDSCLWGIPAGRSDGVVLDATVGDSRRAAAVLAKRESVE